MTTLEIEWTQNEFLAYLLLFAAHADNIFKAEEKRHIQSIIEPKVYTKMLAEFSKDNGYVQVQKIMNFQKENDFFSIDTIVEQMKNLFDSDGEFHSMEQFTLGNIRRLLF